MRLVVRLLGPLEVECGRRLVPIGAGKERLIVVVLALHTGRVVPIERLVDVLWREDPPESAGVSARVLVSRIRKTLAAAGCPDAIGTRAPGYLMAAELVDVDVQCFEDLAARGRAQLAAGSAHEAAGTLRAALAVWRGDRLAEADNPRLAGEAARLAEARLATLELRIDADLACSRHAELVGELDALCQEHPLRERLWAQRMLALYRCGRQADALAAYQRLRSTLADEVGLDPSGGLRRLEAAILVQDPALSTHTDARSVAPSAATAPPAGTSVPLPAPLGVAETVACLGRDVQLGELRQVWDSVLADESRIMLVCGEAGVGKTRLVREFARQAHQRGAVVLHGRCDEDVAIALRPIRECLTHYLTSVPQDRLTGHDRRNLRELTRLVPELAQLLPALPDPTRTDPQAEQYLLFSAVAGLLGEIASETPVILVLDDLHWADRPSLLLLRHLAEVACGRVLIVGTYRDAELTADQPLAQTLAALCREPTVGQIRLQGLAESAVAAVMAAMAGGALDAAGLRLAHDLARDTDGNAFLVVEQARHLCQTGVLTRVDAGIATARSDLASSGLPHTVQQVVAGRLASLGDAAGSVLSLASVSGEQFDLDLLVAATGWDDDRLLDVLEAAEHRALVTEVGRAGSFRFSHAIVRQVIYQRLGPTRQARLHARIGEALENLCGQQPGERAGELARHLLAGRPRDAAKAARYARLAGERALAALAPHEAVGWFSRAIEALQPGTDHAEQLRCLVGLGDAQTRAGLPAGRQTLLDAARMARQLGESELLIRAALASNRGMFAQHGQIDSELVALLETALHQCPPDNPQRARLLSRLAAELTFHHDSSRRRAIADEAVAAARITGDAAALLDALTRPDTALMMPELSDLRLSRLQEARALAHRLDDPIAAFWAAFQLALVLLERADPDGVDQALGHAEGITRRLGQPLMRFLINIARGSQALLAGHLEAAQRLGGEALQIGTASGQADAAVLCGGQMFFIRWHQGRLNDMLPSLNRGAAETPDFMPASASLALAEALGGQPERARRLLHTAAGKGFAGRTVGWLMSHCLWAEVAVELNDHDVAGVLYERLLPWRHLFATSGPFPLHAVTHSLGRLAALNGRFQDADENFAEALAVHQRLGAPFCIAATQRAWGRLLLPHDRDRADRLLASADTIAVRHGYGYLERPVDAGGSSEQVARCPHTGHLTPDLASPAAPPQPAPTHARPHG